MLTPPKRSAGSKGSHSPVGDTNYTQAPPIYETLKQDTQASAQPDQPDQPLDRVVALLAALGFEEVEAVTEPVTDPGDPLGTDTMDNPENLAVEAAGDVIGDILEELHRAVLKHPTPFHSPHEGYAVIKEEFDELWELIKKDRGYGSAARKEVVQVAAMAIRYLLDIDPE